MPWKSCPIWACGPPQNDKMHWLEKLVGNLVVSASIPLDYIRRIWTLAGLRVVFPSSRKPRISRGFLRFSTEEVRFELTGPLRAHRFSRPAHSAALPLLRISLTHCRD